MYYVIERLWLDPTENEISAAAGYTPIGVVASETEALRICNLDFVHKSRCWALSYGPANVPLYKYRQVDALDGLTKDELADRYKL